MKVVFVFIVIASALAVFALLFKNVQVSVKTNFKSRLCIFVEASLVLLFFMNVQASVKAILESRLCVYC